MRYKIRNEYTPRIRIISNIIMMRETEDISIVMKKNKNIMFLRKSLNVPQLIRENSIIQMFLLMLSIIMHPMMVVISLLMMKGISFMLTRQPTIKR